MVTLPSGATAQLDPGGIPPGSPSALRPADNAAIQCSASTLTSLLESSRPRSLTTSRQRLVANVESLALPPETAGVA